MKAAAAVALVLALASSARAAPAPDAPDAPPDPRARRMAGEANLEPTRKREGLALGIGVGPSMQIGLGVDNASGTGGSLDLRIGTSASDRLSWFVDLFYTGTRGNGVTSLDTGGLFCAGAQIYALDSVWFRGGVGLGSLNADSKALAYGLGTFGGGGIDFLRRGRFGLSGEVSVVTGFFRSGVVSAVVLGLGATWW